MSGMQIGRTPVDCPYQMVEYGDTWSFGFEVGRPDDSVTEVRARVEQLRGLAAGDVVPVMFDDDDRLAGFHRIVDLRLEPVDTYLVNGFVRGSAVLSRVSGGAARVDTVISEVNRSAAEYAVSPIPRVAVPLDAYARSTAAGNLDVVVEGGETLRVFGPSVDSVRYLMPLETFNAYGCRIEILWDDSVWRPVIGRSLPAWVTPDRLRMSNGRLRWQFSTGTSSPSALSCEEINATGSAYGARETVATQIGFDGTSTLRLFSQLPRIILNTHAVTVVEFSDSFSDAETVTVRQQRGERFITVTSVGDTGMRVTFADAVGATGTGYATFGDYVFACESAFTASGDIASSVGGGASRSIMIGKPTGTDEDAADLTSHWWAGVTLRDEVS